MKNIIKKIKGLQWLALSLMVTGFISSCSKMDDYKKFLANGEISYTGKLDSIKIMSGNSRVLLKGLFLSDPKITQCKVYWNNMADSVIIPVTRKNAVDSLSFSINNMKEGIQNFTIYTVDNIGNKSIPVYKTGRVYGSRYQSSLSNRVVSSALTLQNGDTRIIFEGMDRLTGVFATDVTYTNNANLVKTMRVSINTDTAVIKNFKLSSNINYRTLFLPDTVSIDTFKSDIASLYVPRYIEQDITATYLKNTGPFTRAAYDGSRWGTLADWITNAAAKNIANNQYGGYEFKGGVGVLSFESGWGINTPVTNGLIYQTITLPAGSYAFQLYGVDQNTGGTRYMAVAEGNTLPNISDIVSKAIAYTNISNGVLKFTLNKQTTVSVGFAVSIANTGQYIKVGSVKLFSQSYQ